MSRLLERVAVSLAVAMLTIGCGEALPERVPVSGVVLIDGVPLTRGIVALAPSGERPSIGAIDEQGRFTLTCYTPGDGVVPGNHRVSVTSAETLDERSVRWHAPKKYSGLDTSGLETSITEPTDDLKIELTWSGGKPFVERR